MSRFPYPPNDRTLHRNPSTIETLPQMAETLRNAPRPQGARPESFTAERVPLGGGVYSIRYIEFGTVDRSREPSSFSTAQRYEIQVSGTVRPQVYPRALPEDHRHFETPRSHRYSPQSLSHDRPSSGGTGTQQYPNIVMDDRRHFEAPPVPRYTSPSRSTTLASGLNARPSNGNPSGSGWYPNIVPIPQPGSPVVAVPAKKEKKVTWRD
ncbi:hypothetical protein VTL71DRAFT_7537 [Oculimacula yallundae]|uniref:Uncharacterized protein n=1 Tax=Oculimacula yallundae TaxID=86028 RepID=A0ABR4BW29_9HELO